ncbi:PREDICTED: proteasomal ubiquitin receptor ADRM1 homolog isoform X1 [Drosophila arizonae]|uniref:Proteasomal ubiquitin receptor ADRM1 homolog isoform X1 n=1 Tax=Drosophila arizonae TaxID=7263 RepID=A0ABM1PXM3_DROAR|nr:PREDICTED: proteasomal ubiquitin receptor ADRM1 homolog isoform X1 [Drosophila arizonae]XP_017871960.1 PREDICTED: proteasomal ubiquitin receptor ADRM1 homolog isoform X2 [Drosophila arizonae]XP_017871961.1 PREDICTED: proteasomal ubiquitin receptor ADRM1 homolog isoform X1 [Drosophila arizonae]
MVDQAIQADHADIVANVFEPPNPNGENSTSEPNEQLNEKEPEPEPKETDVQSYAGTESISSISTGREHGLLLPPTKVNQEHLLEFKAGRMNLIDKQVKPDVRHGMIYLHFDANEHLHFCWKDRHAKYPELDIITEPGNLEFLHVESCKTGRIYVLKYKNTIDRYFFWMQDPHHELDSNICSRVNDLLQYGKPMNESSSDSSRL